MSAPFEIANEKINEKDSVVIRKSDGYVVVSSLSKIIGKDWYSWSRTKTAQDIIEVFSKKEKILDVFKSECFKPNQPKALIESYSQGHVSFRTIVHKFIAIQFAQQDPLIAYELSSICDKYIRGDLTLIKDVVKTHDALNGTLTTKIVLTAQRLLTIY
jgi:hypothetical protein